MRARRLLRGAGFQPVHGWARVGNPCYVGAAILLLLAFSGCRKPDMAQQAKVDPEEPTGFFQDGTSARPVVDGTVARGQLRVDDAMFRGMANGKPVDKFPMAVTKDMLVRGQERYTIFCAACHGALGDGEGMIVQRGMIHPPSYHTERLRTAPVGHFYDVIDNGFGAMYPYNDRIAPADRWAIIAYIRALQLSQNAMVSQLPAADQRSLTEGVK